jgi:hypothetical protein
MNDNKHKKIMSEKIERRLSSDAWNLQIASGVLAKKSGTRKRILYVSSFAASALAAAFLLVFIFGIDTGRRSAGYEEFITQQIEGTMKDVAGKKGKAPVTAAAMKDIVLQNDTDDMIDDALAMR